ncbi:MAG: hypothetical protein [Olavius algarvensis Gamma 1 endosymbiont]|nr:MAG: hypothetical protein [Olavius algarvensis Gamma 1 endosymbiont]
MSPERRAKGGLGCPVSHPEHGDTLTIQSPKRLTEIVVVKMTAQAQIQYISDEEGQPMSVIVPIQLWREITSERETAYLLKSETMKKQLLEAKNRTGGISLDNARTQLGI